MKIVKERRYSAVAGTIACAVTMMFMSTTASAASRIFDLHLKNGSRSETITFALQGSGNGQNFCYEGTPGVYQQVGGPVKPGGQVTVRLARIQGHGCDGQQGIFSVLPRNINNSAGDIKTATGPRAHFTFDNGGHLALSNYPNPLVGRLSAKSAQDGSYTWSTLPEPVVTASKAVGSWERVCQQFCNKTFTQEIINTKTETATTSKETRTALAVSLEAGFEFAGGSAKTSVTASEEHSYAQSMSRELSTSRMMGSTDTVQLTLEQMEERSLFAVWQWVVSSKLNNGDGILLTTVKYTCTPDAARPGYLPGSAQDIAACRLKVAEQPKRVAEQPKSVIDSLAGSRWTYPYGGNEYQFSFGTSTIDNFSNGWWPGITWKMVSANQIRLLNTKTNAVMTVTFNSINNFTTTDWDGRTIVSGRRIN